jgi:WD40 repeat protein
MLIGALCLSPFGHSQDQPPAKPPFPAPRLWKEFDGMCEVARVSPDGKLVAVVAGKRGRLDKNMVIVYETPTGKERCRFPALHSAAGFSGTVTFTPDGKRLVSVVARVPKNPQRGAADHDAIVTDAATGKQLFAIPLRDGQFMHDHGRYAVSDKILVVAGKNEAATVYDLTTGKALGDLPGGQRLGKIALSRDGRWLVASAGKRANIPWELEIHVWDVQKRAYCGKINTHKSPIRSLALSHDGASCAFAAHADPHLYVIDRASGEKKATCDVVLVTQRVRFTSDGKTLVAGGYGPNHGLVFWDWRTSKEIRGGYPKGAETIARLRSQSSEAERKAWHWRNMMDFGMSDDGKTIAFVTEHDKLFLLELAPPKPLEK